MGFIMLIATLGSSASAQPTSAPVVPPPLPLPIPVVVPVPAAVSPTPVTINGTVLTAQVPERGKLVRGFAAEALFDEKSYPLLRRGIALGVGIAAHTNGIGDREFRSTATSSFAYLGALPGYWGSNEETDAYCASSQSTAALSRADAEAVRWTLSEWKAEELNDQIPLTDRINGWEKSPVDKDRNTAWWQLHQAGINELIGANSYADIKEDGRAAVLYYRDWQLEVPAACGSWLGLVGARKIGAFIARPFGTIKTKVRIESETEPREMRPLVTVGLLYAPKPFVHFLFGLTVSAVDYKREDESTDSAYTKSFFIGVGTTIDVLGSFFK